MSSIVGGIVGTICTVTPRARAKRRKTIDFHLQPGELLFARRAGALEPGFSLLRDGPKSKEVCNIFQLVDLLLDSCCVCFFQ